jgi:DNA-binding winged helix-turn-helix (wHTH) protein
MSAKTDGPGCTAGAFRLGDWLVEPSLNRVSRGEESVHIEPKVMEVLVCLAECPAEVVSRNHIIDTVWATEFITEKNLTHAIAVLRKKLGDNPQRPLYIETIYKRGYRLIGKVEPIGPPPSARASRAAPPRAPIVRINEDGVVTLLRDPPDNPLCTLCCLEYEIQLAASEYLVGRGRDTDILIVSAEVSRSHSRLVVTDSGTTIEDAGSKNGTIVNGELVLGAVELMDGDEIDIGSVLLIFRDPLAVATHSKPGGDQPSEAEG